MKATATYTFVNEFANEISMTVTLTDRFVKISASGPNSQVDHEWTHMEIAAMLELLQEVDFDYAKQESKNQDPN